MNSNLALCNISYGILEKTTLTLTSEERAYVSKNNKKAIDNCL